MGEMIKRVGEAIAKRANVPGALGGNDLALVALQAMREPTKRMISAAYDAPVMDGPEAIWRAMIDAAIGRYGK